MLVVAATNTLVSIQSISGLGRVRRYDKICSRWYAEEYLVPSSLKIIPSNPPRWCSIYNSKYDIMIELKTMVVTHVYHKTGIELLRIKSGIFLHLSLLS